MPRGFDKHISEVKLAAICKAVTNLILAIITCCYIEKKYRTTMEWVVFPMPDFCDLGLPGWVVLKIPLSKTLKFSTLDI